MMYFSTYNMPFLGSVNVREFLGRSTRLYKPFLGQVCLTN